MSVFSRVYKASLPIFSSTTPGGERPQLPGKSSPPIERVPSNAQCFVHPAYAEIRHLYSISGYKLPPYDIVVPTGPGRPYPQVHFLSFVHTRSESRLSDHRESVFRSTKCAFFPSRGYDFFTRAPLRSQLFFFCGLGYDLLAFANFL